MKLTIIVNPVYFLDTETNQQAVYFKELPDIIGEGKTKREAMKNLKIFLQNVLDLPEDQRPNYLTYLKKH